MDVNVTTLRFCQWVVYAHSHEWGACLKNYLITALKASYKANRTLLNFCAMQLNSIVNSEFRKVGATVSCTIRECTPMWLIRISHCDYHATILFQNDAFPKTCCKFLGRLYFCRIDEALLDSARNKDENCRYRSNAGSESPWLVDYIVSNSTQAAVCNYFGLCSLAYSNSPLTSWAISSIALSYHSIKTGHKRFSGKLTHTILLLKIWPSSSVVAHSNVVCGTI